MKKIVFMFLAVLSLTAMTAQEKSLSLKKVKTPESTLVNDLDAKVSLTESQMKDAFTIYNKFVKEKESISVLYGEPKKEAMKLAKEKTEKAINAILTDEQRAKLSANKKKVSF